MLSNEMYSVLACFPRKHGYPVEYGTLISLCPLKKRDIDECLNATLVSPWNYVQSSNGFKNGSDLYLTESGLAALEAHEQDLKNLRISENTLIVSKIAMGTAAFSALLAIIELLDSLF